jgi:hypothetical protein
MSLKERIENNLTIFFLTTLLAGFLAGISAYQGILQISGLETVAQGTSGSVADWQDVARKQGWIAQAECPAFPISITITSPGNEAIVEFSDYLGGLLTDVVVQATHPIPSSTQIGYVFNEEANPNYYVVFPEFYPNKSRQIFRDTTIIHLPFQPLDKSKLRIWAVAVPDRDTVGSVYSDTKQILNSSPGAVMSESISITIQK